MKASIKLFTSDGESDLGFPVKLVLYHDKKVRRKVIAHAKSYEWDSKENIPSVDHPDHENLYEFIFSIKSKSRKKEFKYIHDFDAAFGYLLKEDQETRDFIAYGEQRALQMEKENRHGNARAYRIALRELYKYQPHITFDDLTNDFLNRFKEYKKSEGNKNSTIKNYLVEYRAIYNVAVRKNITQDKKPFEGLFEDIPVKRRRARNRYLTKEQIKALENLKLDKSYQRAVDLSLLQFYLCGADLTDIYFLKNEDVVQDRVFLSRNKLGSRGYEFDVLLPEKAKSIIDKYRGKGEYVFPWKKDPQGYITFRNNHNRNLKILQKRLKIELQPKNDNLTTKVMRHTFATLGKFYRIEEDLLRELMGHERNDIDTVYKDKYPEAERDAAQMKIISTDEV
ncbi:tyrosine-type recombinase/integrase [Salinimicrobium sp. GXAS 041]|uniref:tyrosine-type recombinase/integrase n=1 Tax=Salinimicrobium sp. GXAS 041 TaxID=3400806 RepID=UPI003C721DBC